MIDEKQLFSHTQEETDIINEMLKKGRRDVPTFLEEGACEILYVPIDDG